MEDTQNLLDRGFGALGAENWQEAREIFRSLLQQEPHSGMGCLGAAMAAKEISGRQALADRWENLSRDPEFMGLLQNAEPDFLPWLRQDMAAAREPRHPAPEKRPAWLENFSRQGRRRKLLLICAALQVVLYLTASLLIAGTMPGENGFLSDCMAGLAAAAMLTGLPLILGPVYGNALIRGSRFRKLLHILNTIAGVAGSLLHLLFIAAYTDAIRTAAVPDPEDGAMVMISLLCLIIHLLALFVPRLLVRLREP